jgi:putative hydrolase of the HAD superfamily
VIHAVTIDFWNTLFDTSNGDARKSYRDQALSHALQFVGFDWDTDRIRAAYKTAYETFEQQWFGARKTQSASESLHIMWRQLGVNMPQEKHVSVVRAFEDSILIGMPEPMPGAVDAVTRLAEDCRLAIISDTAVSPGSMLRKVMQHHGFDGLITAYVFSDETGVAKPHPDAFHTALSSLGGLRPENAVHIGDIERTDITGAKGVGMKAILFEGDAGKHSYNEGCETQADERTASWYDIPSIVQRLREGGIS